MSCKQLQIENNRWLVPTYLAGQHFTAKDILNNHDFEYFNKEKIAKRYNFQHVYADKLKDMLPNKNRALLITCATAWLYDSFKAIRQYKIVRKEQ